MRNHIIATTLFVFANGVASAAPYFSAKQILIENPSSPNGIYTIDTDGEGGAAAFDIYADMTTAGGGWTLGLLSLKNDPSASTDMVSNTGTASLSSPHTRDLTNLAITQNAQIRYVLQSNGAVLFDGYYSGNYHGTFPQNSDWVVLEGAVSFGFSYHQGMDWSTSDHDVDNWIAGNCAVSAGDQPWYYNACYSDLPTGGWTANGPVVDGAMIDSWAIYVREENTPAYSAETGVEGQAPMPGTLWLLGFGLGGLLARRRLRLHR